MAMFSKMVSLARSVAEVKTAISENSVAPRMTAPLYPYGTTICLEDESLEKLGLGGSLPDVGDMIHFCGMAKVTSASQREEESAGGEKKTCRRVELQITDMGLENEAEENTAVRRDAWYGGKDAA